MRIAIASTQVPLVFGGAEILARNLQKALEKAGHDVALIEVPFKWYPVPCLYDHVLANQLIDLSESCGTAIDRMIGLKFPAWLMQHPNTVMWILHQHRSAYDLWDSGQSDLQTQSGGEAAKEMIRACDRKALLGAKGVYTIAKNVSKRLNTYCGVDAEALYSPPDDAELYHSGEAGDYLFYPSRLSAMKRQDLVIKALKYTNEKVRIRFAGASDNGSDYADKLKKLAVSQGVGDRIEWLGRISNAEKIEQYAGSIGVVYPPVDEDYGYITLETMLAAKPLITTTDAGGPLEFVLDQQTGLIAEAEAKSLAAAMDQLWADRTKAKQMGEAGRDRYQSMPIGWDHIVERLTA